MEQQKQQSANELQVENCSIFDKTKGIICHQVNCQGVMGKGLALQIRNKYPNVYTAYKDYCASYADDKDHLLGQVQLIGVGPSDDLFVCNVFGQLGYGRDKRYTDYGAVTRAFRALAGILARLEERPKVYIPYLMGCGLAGGDWLPYQNAIKTHIPDATVCKFRP